MAGRRQIERESTLAENFAGLKSDYNAAKNTQYRKRLTGVNPMGSGADFHYRTQPDFLKMIELARSIDRNDPILGQGVDRVIDNVLQDGITVDPQTGSDDLNENLKERWVEWSTDPRQAHKGAEFDLHELARKVLRARLIDGDSFVLPLAEGSIEVIENHRCRTPDRTKRNVIHGVLLDQHRRPLQYWFTKDDLNPLASVKFSDIRAIPAWDREGNRLVLHIKNPKRVSQTRGVTVLAPIIDQLGMHDDIQFAKMVQQQVASCWAVFHIRAESRIRGGPDQQTGPRTTDTMSDGNTRTLEGLSPGMVIEAEEGEKLEGFSPNIPNPEFFQQMWLILQIVASNIGIPAHVLLLDPSKTNFSGWRGAIEQARIGFRCTQKFMVSKFYRPLYEWKVRQWLATDPALRTLAAPNDVFVMRHVWHPPTWPYIEPSKDAKADKTRLDELMISPRRYQNERGRVWTDVAGEIVEDRALLVELAIDRADTINTKHPDAELDWRELIGGQPKIEAEPEAPEVDADES